MLLLICIKVERSRPLYEKLERPAKGSFCVRRLVLGGAATPVDLNHSFRQADPPDLTLGECYRLVTMEATLADGCRKRGVLTSSGEPACFKSESC